MLTLQIIVAMAAVLGVVLYRMSVLTALYGFSNNSMVTSYAILLTTATAAGINLCCIVVFNWIYIWLAEYLTEACRHLSMFLNNNDNNN
jgi:anoctamin-1